MDAKLLLAHSHVDRRSGLPIDRATWLSLWASPGAGNASFGDWSDVDIEQSETAIEMAQAANQHPGKGILLVEDDPKDVILTLRAFQRIHLKDQVAVVSDGAEALDYLLGAGDYVVDPPSLPRLVLLDLHLPKLNGLEVLDRIRTDPRTRYLPVVAFTASLAERDMIASYLGGANSCVRKPETFADFAETLRQIWHYWSSINEVPNLFEAGAKRAAMA